MLLEDKSIIKNKPEIGYQRCFKKLLELQLILEKAARHFENTNPYANERTPGQAISAGSDEAGVKRRFLF